MSTREFQERKIILRNLLNTVENLEDKQEYGIQTVKDVGEVLKEINQLERAVPLIKRVEHAEDILLDGNILSVSSDVLTKCMRAVDVSLMLYDGNEFADRLREYVCKENEDFSNSSLMSLLPEARSCIGTTDSLSFLFGSFNFNDVPKVKLPKSKAATVAEKAVRKEPEKLQNVDKEEEGIDEIVKIYYEILLNEYRKNEGKPINYYYYVIDTEDFSKTIENMFYTSFLVRNGKARIDLDKKNNPIIEPVSKKELKEFRGKGGNNSQIITSIAMEDWQTYKDPGLIQKLKKKD